MVSEYIGAMKTLQPRGPYFLLGECFGGPVAYATAQQLRAQGENVAFLAFLDVRNPRQTLRRYFWRRLTARVRYRFDPITEADGWRPLWVRTAFHWNAVKRLGAGRRLRYCLVTTVKALRLLRDALRGYRATVVAADEGGAEDETAEQRARAQKVYWLAVNRYRGRPYGGRITVFANAEWYAADETLGWTGLAPGRLEVHKIPGNHLTYMSECIDVVASELRECLDRAVAEANRS
jgi:thioesterase domain-containing protein